MGGDLTGRLIPAESIRSSRHARQCLAVGAGLFRELLFRASDRWFCIPGGGPVESGSLSRDDWNKFLLLPDGSRRRLGRSTIDDSLRVSEFWSWTGSDAPGLSQRRCGFSRRQNPRLAASFPLFSLG